jgi:CubicO group peptidase (beta-lactamase class C family)
VTHRLSADAEARFWEGVAASGAFFMGNDPVHAALDKLARSLEALQIPYAIAGAMALNEYGYRRTTVDVDVLLTRESLQKFKDAWLGRGYVEKFPGSRGMRDTENGVGIDVLVAGDYPGDGRPKPVRFPDPAEVAIRGARVALLPVAKLVELKLASGLSSIHRAKDIGDVVELIKHAKLSRVLADELDASVRDKYLEIWDALQTPDPLAED